MDDHTDDRNPDLPPVGTPEELEEALKWLEDLTARQGKPADKSAPAPAASLDSPFRGLIDSEDGDLPDWLRELPASQQLDNNEPESRLDWLAKMAQQESIEELPTLEWRRLSEPAQNAILSGQNIEMLTEAYPGPTHHDEPGSDTPVELSADSIDEAADESINRASVELPAEPTTDSPEETPFMEIEAAAEDNVIDEAEQPESTSSELDLGRHDEGALPASIAPVTMGLDEILSLERPAENMTEMLPDHSDEDEPLDDLDAAMAWIEELAASQNAPIEEVPSVADRALASKLMMEAGLTPTVSPLDELGSDSDFVEGLTPTHPFIEEEDFADTVVLMETLTADHGIVPDPGREPEDIPVNSTEADFIGQQEALEEPEGRDDIAAEIEESIVLEETPEELSFEEAMAFLDEIADSQTPDEGKATEAIIPEIEALPTAVASIEELAPENAAAERHEETLVETINNNDDSVIADFDEADTDTDTDTDAFESLSADDVPWLDTPAEQMVVVSPVNYDGDEDTNQTNIENVNGNGYGELEMALLSLDALALPPGRTLDDVAAKLTAAQMAPWRNMDSALDWLEQTLNEEVTPVVEPTSELDDASLIEQMPDDPDAVLAWLEQIAAQEGAQAAEVEEFAREESSAVITKQTQSEPFVEELAEADLLNMPDDPDEAMAWLEGLARGGQPASSAAEKQMTADGPQPEDFTEVEVVIEEEVAAAGPETESIDTATLDIQTLEEPESESFVSQEVVLPDVDIEDYAVSLPEAPTEGETASFEKVEVGEGKMFDGDSEATGDSSGDELFAEDINLLDEPAIVAGIEIIDLPEQRTEIAGPNQQIVNIDDEVRAEKEIVAETMNEPDDEEPAVDEQPTEKPAVAVEEKPHLPSWLDLLKPLD